MEIEEQEYFQLPLEEAFFLSYSVGVLIVLDPVTQLPIPNQELFTLFRKSSYFPPLTNPSLAPDDPFMLDYVVYHHFRSLGWIVRGGVNFVVDFMLYVRGPVFLHVELAIVRLRQNPPKPNGIPPLCGFWVGSDTSKPTQPRAGGCPFLDNPPSNLTQPSHMI
ncbi:MAG: tRNA splicing endonuclease subunit sen2 [Claussenomyces sp. TS43310]|nr:MAG: tRNA splicing endonuclease subunit sen2 [Claussenomyces sp. TS43310]